MNLGRCPECGNKEIWHNLKEHNYYCKECGYVFDWLKDTNAGKIREMTDDELAEFLEKVELGEFWQDIKWIDWLKQEVE